MTNSVNKKKCCDKRQMLLSFSNAIDRIKAD